MRRAFILLKTDAVGPAWSDAKIAEAYLARARTIEKIRQRFVDCGFEETLSDKRRQRPPTEKLRDGQKEAKAIGTRLRSTAEEEGELGNRRGPIAGMPQFKVRTGLPDQRQSLHAHHKFSAFS